MDDTSLFDELVHRLNLDDGSADGLPDRTGVVLRGWRGRGLDPPYMLHVDPPTLGEHLRSMEGVSELFPGTAPGIGALRLFLVHVGEAVETAPQGHRHLVIGPAGVYARPEAPPRTDRGV
ncbi:hypothetical protein NGM33_02860 [Nocardiopsis dassonvillei]|jgi:hypothetical protein|uniref:hypothetical protein n=1 Tax=Nocardiopsis dassonvillei TaxID=2014 RepID=UPI0020A2DCE9|nr:hypothetical protein [Nocardiopsis dassonvillei]MCP3012255.1 hypothetical protein [Nocardiopsis dassonvillei]